MRCGVDRAVGIDIFYYSSCLIDVTIFEVEVTKQGVFYCVSEDRPVSSRGCLDDAAGQDKDSRNRKVW